MVEEMPIGGGNKDMGPEHAPAGEDKVAAEKDKPIEERLKSKNWQVR
jgi:hypothetical protein